MKSREARSRHAPSVVSILFIALAMIVPSAAQTPPPNSWVRQDGTGSFDQAHAVGYGGFGVYVAGDTVGSFGDQPSAGGKDAFIGLYGEDDANLRWIRQFGSTNQAEDVATGVAGDESGAYVVGYTAGQLKAQSQAGSYDSFIRKYDVGGTDLWTRQFGSLTDDYALAVATHASGVYVVGQVDCCAGALPGQPTTAGTDAFVKKFDGGGNELWTRMIGTGEIERALGVAVDDSGVYVAGTTTGELAGPSGYSDGYVRKYGHDGGLLWTRQFGTVRADGTAANDEVFAIAAGPTGVFVAGATAEGTAPGSGQTFAGGLWDGFVVGFDAGGTSRWYRQIGTDGDDYAYGIAVGAGQVLVAGGTGSSLVRGSFSGGEDAFLRLYDVDGNALSTQQFGNGLNDSGRGVVPFPGGFFVGGTKNGDALHLEGRGDNDFFVMRVTPPPFVPEGGVAHAATLASAPAPLAPGSLAVVSGAYLNDGPSVLSSRLSPDGTLTTSLGGTQITVNGVPAPVLYSTSWQVGIQIPFEVAGQSTAVVTVAVGGQTSIPRSINIAPTAPGVFTANQAGTGRAIVVHEDGIMLVTPQNPARRNEVVVLYLTGSGVLDPPLGTGVPAGANAAAAPASLMFGTSHAVVEFAGAAPGWVGLNHIKARIPADAPTGSDVPVSITVGGRQANPVTIAIGESVETPIAP
jgi:uncharacterized protein (TIGR03437 family)